MTGRRLLCALIGTTLAALLAPPPAAAAAAPVPCPTVRVTPKPSRPPKPTPPPAVPEQKAVGGPDLASPGLVVPAGASRAPAVTASSWLVADLDTGEVLGACGAHEYGTPASVQKLLLAATMIPRLDPKQRVRVTRADLNFEPGSSAVGLLQGGVYSVELLWLGLLLQSGNDAANVLARLGGGSQAGGVRLMNEEARRLGALQTHAVTPSGLDGPGQFTSAYDLALIARACFALPAFQRYTLVERVQVPRQPRATPPDPRGFQIQNENDLIREYDGALGGKTGFTSLARHTYVGAAERGGRRLVVTLLGAEPRPLRGWQQGAALLDWGFAQPAGAGVGRLVSPGSVAAPTPTATPSSEPGPTAHVEAVPRSHSPAPARAPFVVAGVAVVIVLAFALALRAVRRRR
ncbi:D-alanyl-D-alanine carboxypeptidase [Asanoa sp. NPDC050611]|uniref:D-alanyl-D-alanine carboxypeptidase family protein n=1 Tax=Asanoa sp. NPDC050611 TaxID=3157098 RepID=UPI00340F56FC